MKHEAIKPIGYADDILILLRGKDRSTMANLVNNCLKRIGDWNISKGLTCNPAKTTMVLLNRAKKKTKERPSIRLHVQE